MCSLCFRQVLQTFALPLGDRAFVLQNKTKSQKFLKRRDSFLSRACGGSRFYRRIRDRRTDQIAPLGPRTVVIAHIFEPEQILQHEPGVRTALANAAIGDHFVAAVNSLSTVELL